MVTVWGFDCVVLPCVSVDVFVLEPLLCTYVLNTHSVVLGRPGWELYHPHTPTPTHTHTHTHTTGVINLNTCTQVNSREPMKGHRHVFDIHTEERIYHLVAESGEEKQEWIDTLKTLLFTPQVRRPSN